jgi:predicted GNAT family acetyltransferase
MKIDVQHDESSRKYYAVIDGKESILQYSPQGQGTLNFWRTYVPPELRGRGIADEIVRQALEDALQQGYKIIPSCWFVRVYMERHSRYQEMMAGG